MAIEYRVILSRSAEREYFALPRSIQERTKKAIDALAENPRPFGVRKMQSADDLYRIRVGDYRIIYAIDDGAKIVDVNHIRHRKDAYR